MKIKLKLLFFFFSISISTCLFSQENFQPGYIITQRMDTVHGLIDYRNWEKNPGMIKFKSGKDGDVATYKPSAINSFSVGEETYVSAPVQLEKSPHLVNELNYSSEFSFASDTIFLQLLIRGDKSLYYYKDAISKDNFFIKDKGEYKILLYKQYLQVTDGKEYLAANKAFKQQLADYFSNCPTINTQLAPIEYNTSDLKKIFNYYFSCTNSNYKPERKEEKKLNSFGITTGLSFVNTTYVIESIDFVPVTASYRSVSPIIGINYNYVLPRNQGRFSIYNDLFFSRVKIKGEYVKYQDADINSKTTYSVSSTFFLLNSVVRYKFPIKNFFTFINAGISNNFNLSLYNNKKVENKFYTTETVEEFGFNRGFSHDVFEFTHGFGFQYKRLSIDIRSFGISADLPFSSGSDKRTFLLFAYSLK